MISTYILFEQTKPKQSLGTKIKGHLKRNWGKYAIGAASLGAVAIGDRIQDKGESNYYSSIQKNPEADWKSHRKFQMKRDLGKNIKLAGLAGIAGSGAYDYAKNKIKSLSKTAKDKVQNTVKTSLFSSKKPVHESTLIYHTDGTKVKWDMTIKNPKQSNDKGDEK